MPDMKRPEPAADKTFDAQEFLKSWRLTEKSRGTTPSCQICGNSGARVYFSLQGMNIYRCGWCGLQFTGLSGASPSVTRRFYGKTFFEASSSACDTRSYYSYADRRKAVMENAKIRLAHASRKAHKGAFLEIGCAMGFGLEAARQEGWDATGFDISRFAASSSAKSTGIRVESESLKKLAENSRGKFDLVAGFDILTHMTQPTADLEHICDLLAPGGILLLEEGITDSVAGRLMRKKWFHYIVPFHVHFFSRGSFRKILKNAGLEILEEAYLPRVENLRELAVLAGGLFLPNGARGAVGRLCKVLPSGLSLRYNSMSNLAITARKARGGFSP